MTDEPTTTPVNHDDNQPATKGDVRQVVDELARVTSKTFDKLDSRIIAIESDVRDLTQGQQRLETKVDGLDTKVDNMNRSINQRLDHLVELVADLPKRVKKLESKATFRQ